MRAKSRQAAFQQIAPGFQIQDAAPVHRQGEGHIGARHRQPLDHIQGGEILGARALEEFQPRRRGIKKLAHFHPRARLARAAKGGGRRAADGAAFDGDFVRIACPGAAGNREPRHRADAGQRLAAKAQGFDMGEIVLAAPLRQLRGGMALDRQAKVVRLHAAAIVFDQDEIGATVRSGNIDTARAGIERVLDQFLHRRGGTLDHFARSDAVDGALRKPPDSQPIPLSDIAAPALFLLPRPADRKDPRPSIFP